MDATLRAKLQDKLQKLRALSSSPNKHESALAAERAAEIEELLREKAPAAHGERDSWTTASVPAPKFTPTATHTTLDAPHGHSYEVVVECVDGEVTRSRVTVRCVKCGCNRGVELNFATTMRLVRFVHAHQLGDYVERHMPFELASLRRACAEVNEKSKCPCATCCAAVE